MAEIQDGLHRAFLTVVDDPAQVLNLQVGDADMAHESFLLQFHQRGQCLIYYLLETSGQ